jgi:hypothetical protein
LLLAGLLFGLLSTLKMEAILSSETSVDFGRTISDKAQGSTYAVAEIVTKKIKSFTIEQSVIWPACCKIVNIMFGEEHDKIENPCHITH